MLNNFSKNCHLSFIPSFCQNLIINSEKAYAINNGNIPKWHKALNEIKEQLQGDLTYQAPYLKINVDDINSKQLEQILKKFKPWRKGPYQVGNLKINSEWSGDKKWNRLVPHIKSLKNKAVLDVGCGNGYFTFKISLAGANIALGIEPFLLFNYQFQAINALIKKPPNAFVLPLKLEQIPQQAMFDTVFSLGVLYHQKDYKLHLQQLKNVMKNCGQLILETLIIENGDTLIPKGRYARMRNVWVVPSIEDMHNWLLSTGFKNIKLVDVSQTRTDEQRATSWIGDNAASLKDFLDSNNSDLTIEGYPAPKRAIFICDKS